MTKKILLWAISASLVAWATQTMPLQAQELADDDYSYDGFLEPAEDVLVAAIEIGRLEQLNVAIGDRVEKGQELARLEDSMQVVSLEAAKQLASMRGELEAATAECTAQQKRAEQLRILASTGSARPDELTRAETDLMIATARLLIAQEQQLGRQLEVQRQEVQLERRRVLSPLSGVVARITRHPGEYVSPGDASIVRVISKESLIAVFNLPASDAIRLRVSQKVIVRPRTIPREAQGTVESIAPSIDGESGTIAVRVRIQNIGESMLPGDRCLMANVRQLSDLQAQEPGPRQLRTQTR